jgi:DNA-binding transcriptional LysR family regulator
VFVLLCDSGQQSKVTTTDQGDTTMEFKQLEMLVALAEEGTVQKAADRVFRTQPAVSIALRKLEDELGTKILDRGKRRSRLTEAGRLLYDYATELLRVRDQAFANVSGLPQELGGGQTTNIV